MKKLLLTTAQAAEYLGGLKPNTLEGWRVKGIGPRYIKISRLVRYCDVELERYLETNSRNSTSETPT